MITQRDNVIESVRDLLADNKKALEALDFLEKENKMYQSKKIHTYMMYLIAATTLLIFMYFTHKMKQSNSEIGILLPIFVGIIGIACIGGIPHIIFDMGATSIQHSIQIYFINDLLSEYATYEDFPVIKAGNKYYIDLPDGMRQVRLDNVMYDKTTQIIGREYRYRELCWNSQGFFLLEITEVKVCNNE